MNEQSCSGRVLYPVLWSSFICFAVCSLVLLGCQNYNKCYANYCSFMQYLANHIVLCGPFGWIPIELHVVRGCVSVQTLDGDVLPLTFISNTTRLLRSWSSWLKQMMSVSSSHLWSTSTLSVFLNDPWISDYCAAESSLIWAAVNSTNSPWKQSNTTRSLPAVYREIHQRSHQTFRVTNICTQIFTAVLVCCWCVYICDSTHVHLVL